MNILEVLRGSRADIVRKAQEIGIQGASRVGAALLREETRTDGELEDWQRSTFQHFQRRVCRSDADDLPSADEIDALGTSLRFMQQMPAVTRQKMSGLLVLLEVGPLILGPERVRFTDLDGELQDTYLRDWEVSRLAPQRAIFQALKSIAVMGYWTHPATWPVIGYSIEGNPGVPDHVKQSMAGRTS